MNQITPIYQITRIYQVPVHVISWGSDVHHLHGTARQPEGQWPQRALPGQGGGFEKCLFKFQSGRHLPQLTRSSTLARAHFTLFCLMSTCSRRVGSQATGAGSIYIVMGTINHLEGRVAMAFQSIRYGGALDVVDGGEGGVDRRGGVGSPGLDQ